MPSKDELDAVREHYGSDVGAVEHVSRALGERENAAAYEQDTGPADKVLAHFGWPPRQADAGKAAAARAAAAEGDADAPARPPAGRSARPRQQGA